MRTGSCSASPASVSVFFLKVALNRSVCRSGRTCSKRGSSIETRGARRGPARACLPLSNSGETTYVVDNGVDLCLEAHVQHAVGLIEDQVGHPAQVGRLVAEAVDSARGPSATREPRRWPAPRHHIRLRPTAQRPHLVLQKVNEAAGRGHNDLAAGLEGLGLLVA